MDVPERFAKLIVASPQLEVSYGYGGIRILGASELKEGQIGYSVSSDGKALCGCADGDWRSSWLVIGYDICLGDPIFIDTADPDLKVFTAMHGEGSWNPITIASSIETFAIIFEEFSRIAKGRSNPVEQENNPLSNADRKSYLSRVNQLNAGQVEIEFWDAMLEN